MIVIRPTAVVFDYVLTKGKIDVVFDMLNIFMFISAAILCCINMHVHLIVVCIHARVAIITLLLITDY